MADDRVYKRLTDEFDRKYQGDFGASLIEEIQRDVKISR